MFCPKCAAQNVDGASFCRVCGANVSLIPQALTGQLPEAPEPEKGAACAKNATWESAFRSLFMGVAFLLIAIALGFSRMGGGWWFYMLIPASVMMATGVAHYMRMKERQKRQFQPGMMGQHTFQQTQQPSFHPGFRIAIGLTNKVRSREQSEPRSEPVVGQARNRRCWLGTGY